MLQASIKKCWFVSRFLVQVNGRGGPEGSSNELVQNVQALPKNKKRWNADLFKLNVEDKY
jgi:hypothetical protein